MSYRGGLFHFVQSGENVADPKGRVRSRLPGYLG